MKADRIGKDGKRHGWFVIPGVQHGDRTLEEQLVAVIPARDECAGKDVLDMGCAEGLVTHSFAEAGARVVHGWDIVPTHITVANSLFSHPAIKYAVVDLNKVVGKEPKRKFDIVLALGVIHKLWRPDHGLKFACRSCSDLLVLRSGKRGVDGYINSKRDPSIMVKVEPILVAEGFVYEKTVKGHLKWNEDADYWRRKK